MKDVEEEEEWKSKFNKKKKVSIYNFILFIFKRVIRRRNKHQKRKLRKNLLMMKKYGKQFGMKIWEMILKKRKKLKKFKKRKNN